MVLGNSWSNMAVIHQLEWEGRVSTDCTFAPLTRSQMTNDNSPSASNGRATRANDVLVSRQDDGCEAGGKISEARGDQKNAQNSGNEAGLHDQDTEGEEPKTPECLFEEIAMAPQPEETQRESVQLRPGENGQEVCAAQKDQRCNLIDEVHNAAGDSD